LIVGAALAIAAGLAWLWLLRSQMAGGSMDGMAMAPPPLTAAYLLPAFAMWAIMMVAMMVPSATPMILLHARIDRAETQRARTFNSLLFALAYLLVWAGFSAAAAVAQALLVSAGLLSHMALTLGNRLLAAAVLGVAAVYELTAAKRLCLDKCQSPMLFILRFWKPGAAGAFRLGIRHGLYCVGCCWALMLLLFVGGVMNLAWVAVLGIVVLGEKFAPPRWRAERFVAAVLFIAAIAVAMS
jgi:predicted metal-binding membrane protein